MRVRFGTSALTSLMTFGLEPASNDSSFTLKIVFSFGFAASSAPAPASSAPEAPGPAPAAEAAPAAGRAISWMFRRVFGFLYRFFEALWCKCMPLCDWGFFFTYLKESDEI